MSDETFETSDLGIAALLLTCGHEFQGFKSYSERRVLFLFKKEKQTDQLAKDYVTGTANAPAKALFDNYRHLRAGASEYTDKLFMKQRAEGHFGVQKGG